MDNGVKISFQNKSMVIDMDRALNKSQIDKITKAASILAKTKSTKDEPTRQEEIERFLEKYHLSESNADCSVDEIVNGISVREERHTIPLLLMEVYADKYGHFAKKVKGLWEKRPDDWKIDVPFVDPNNKLKLPIEADGTSKNSKPKKEILNSMLTYLVGRYLREKQSEEDRQSFLQNAYFDPFLAQAFESSDERVHSIDDKNVIYLRESEEGDYKPQLVTSNSVGYSSGETCSGLSLAASLTNSLEHMSACLDDVKTFLPQYGMSFNASACSSGSLSSTSPEQVQDDDAAKNAKDWDPIQQLTSRLYDKLRYFKERCSIDDAIIVRLVDIYDLIFKSSSKSSEFECDLMLLLERGYRLEFFIDIVRSCQGLPLPGRFSSKLEEFHEELLILDFIKTDQNETPLKESGCEDGMWFSTGCMGPTDAKSLNIASRVDPGSLLGQVPVIVRPLTVKTGDAAESATCASSAMLASGNQSSGGLSQPVPSDDDDVGLRTEEVDNNNVGSILDELYVNGVFDTESFDYMLNQEWPNVAPIQEIGDIFSAGAGDEVSAIREYVDDVSPTSGRSSSESDVFVCPLESPSGALSNAIDNLMISSDRSGCVARTFEFPGNSVSFSFPAPETSAGAKVAGPARSASDASLALGSATSSMSSLAGYAYTGDRPAVFSTNPMAISKKAVATPMNQGVLPNVVGCPTAMTADPVSMSAGQGAPTTFAGGNIGQVVLTLSQWNQLLKNDANLMVMNQNPSTSLSINPVFLNPTATASSVDRRATANQLPNSVDNRGGASTIRQVTSTSSGINPGTSKPSSSRPLLNNLMRKPIAEKRKFVPDCDDEDSSFNNKSASEPRAPSRNALIPIMVEEMEVSDSNSKPVVKRPRMAGNKRN